MVFLELSWNKNTQVFDFTLYTLKKVQVNLAEPFSGNRKVRSISGVKAPETHLNFISGKLLLEQVQVWLPENNFLLQSVPK